MKKTLLVNKILVPVFLVLVGLIGCTTPKTVIVTQEVTREVEVTRLVTEKSAEKPTAVPTYTRYPTYTPYPTSTVRPTSTSTATPAATPSPTARTEATATTAASPTPTATQGPTRRPTTPTPANTPTPAMTRIVDTDPAPPLTVLVSANRAGDNSTYMVTGIVRNDSTETYEAISVNATFFDDQDFRHGPLKVEFPFLLLKPGEECPFSVELAARRVTAFLLHPNGRPTKRESAAITLSNVNLIYDSADSVRITGTATNINAFKIKNIAIAGVLRDASGEIVSLGSTFLLQEDITANAQVRFELRIPRVSFARYQLYGQAERDWE